MLPLADADVSGTIPRPVASFSHPSSPRALVADSKPAALGSGQHERILQMQDLLHAVG